MLELRKHFHFKLRTILGMGVIIIIVISSCNTQKTSNVIDMEPMSTKKLRQVDTMSVEFLLGHFDAEIQPDFVLIEPPYSSRPEMYMQKEAYESFLAMAEEAENEGINFCILSAFRNFEYQANIWNNKWQGLSPINGTIDACITYPEGLIRAQKIMEYSAMPGTSRHHWGTDIDINALEDEYFETQEGQKVYSWLAKNGNRYGFFQPYNDPKINLRKGYNEEKWHWSFLPLARPLTHRAQNLIKDNHIVGFEGDQYSDALNVVENYIMGINPTCL